MPSKRSSSNPRRFASKRPSSPKRRRRVVTSLWRVRANSFISRQADRSLPREVPAKPRPSRKRIRSGGTSPTGISPLARSANRDCTSMGQSSQRARTALRGSLAIAPATRSTSAFVIVFPRVCLVNRPSASAAASAGTPPVQFRISFSAELSVSIPIERKGARNPVQSWSWKIATRNGGSWKICQKLEVRDSSSLQRSYSLALLPVTRQRPPVCASVRSSSHRFLVIPKSPSR